MRRYFIMGRGRKGLIEQSERKKKHQEGIEKHLHISLCQTEKYSYLNKPLIL